MTSLFARIFLWFWGLMLLIMLVTGGTVTLIAWYRFSAVADFNSAQTNMAAQSALDAQGQQGLVHWLEEQTRKDRTVVIFALDPSGHDLLSRNVPPIIRNTTSPWRGDVMGAMQARDRPAFMQKRSHILLSSLLMRQGRPAYWLIAAWSGSTPFDVLGSSDAWIALIVLFVVLGTILCWLLARGISQPIVALQDRARRLAKGDFDATIGPHLTRRRDEIGQLAAEFNQMAEQIRDQLASKEMLLRDISHELRSPLTRLRVAAGLARAKGGEIDLHVERIERDIERLDRLIDDTLRFSMVTTPGLAIERDSVDLAELAGEAMRDAEIEALAKSLSLHCPDEGPIPIAANADLLYRAIDNVLRNAIRHSPVAGAIAISFRIDQDHVTMDISDEGPGVPDQDLERIFEAFYRVSPARERSTGGAGLGLALASRIVSLHSGHIVARNGEAGGLIITMTLPLL